MRTFLLKAKHFLKRHIYPITVGLCTILVLGVVSVSAYSAIKKNNQTIVTEGPSNLEQGTEDGNTDTTPTTGNTPIIFDLPFEGATVSKEYTDSSLLYDKTTKLWCTHQGIDFGAIEGQVAKAVYDGKISKVESSMMNGTVVYLKISDSLTIVYKGLGSDASVKEGDSVKKGQDLGKITGFLAEQADGIHLHIEALKDGKLADPTEYFSFNK